jgi:hypothetical protein
LEYCLLQADYTRFKQEYKAVSTELQQVLWEFHEDTLLHHITAEQDTELLLLIQEHLRVNNIDTLYLAPEMIQELIATGTPHNLETVADWLCTDGSKVLFYPYLFKAETLWKVFLERIQMSPQNVAFLLEPLKAFQGYYAIEFEEILSTIILPLLPSIKEDRKLSKELYKAFEELPDIQTYIDADHLHLLRNFIKYELNRDADLLEKLVNSNLEVLTQFQQQLICDSILDRLLILRSLQIWNPEKVEQHLQMLLENALQNSSTLLNILDSMEKLQLSREAYKVVEKVFSNLKKKLPAGPIQGKMSRVLKPPASLFGRLTDKLLHFKDFGREK